MKLLCLRDKLQTGKYWLMKIILFS